MNLLFAADTPWSWDAERTFAELKQEMDGVGGKAKGIQEMGIETNHADKV